jgi:deoxyribodipyrimidine photo-lyase
MSPSRRVRALREEVGHGPVIYWVSRDQRVHDNHAFSYADALARENGSELLVAFCLAPEFLGAQEDHFTFMLRGLGQMAETLEGLGVPFHFLSGSPGQKVGRLAKGVSASAVVCDFDPLRVKREWRAEMMAECECAVMEVDAHNIVPCWAASPKREWAAATFRPKIRGLLPSYLQEMPAEVRPRGAGAPDEGALRTIGRMSSKLAANARHPPSGESAALAALRYFISGKLNGYAEARNDPCVDGQSGLSPYMHFGQISAQRVALEVSSSAAPDVDKGAFLEELIVRRELSDNFCHYEKDYDSAECFPAWAKASLLDHLADRREYDYSLAELEAARTHDPLWNAAQRQMVATGKMHGYLRMYWAKKILEWSQTPELAMRAAILLNDRYELDGRDPNGYAGIAWSIGGVHDRAWPSRPVFGKVRYMSLGGARSKFDADAFVAKYGG